MHCAVDDAAKVLGNARNNPLDFKSVANKVQLGRCIVSF